MVTKVFNIQPVLFHQCYLCHLLWFKKQSFMLVWKPNPPVAQSAACTFALVLMKIWLLLQCAVALQRTDALEQQTMHLHKCDHVNFFYWGGGRVVRLTAKPRYLLLHHRGKEKSNTITALFNSAQIGLLCPFRSFKSALVCDTMLFYYL